MNIPTGIWVLNEKKKKERLKSTNDQYPLTWLLFGLSESENQCLHRNAGSAFWQDKRRPRPNFKLGLFWLHSHETFNVKSLFRISQSVFYHTHPDTILICTPLNSKFYKKNLCYARYENPLKKKLSRCGRKKCGNVFLI